MYLAYFFEQDHQLHIIILGISRKDDLNVHVFQNRNWFNLKSDRWNFFLALAVRGAFHSKAFRWGKIWGTGLISEKKTEVLFAKLTKERKQPPVVILQQPNFYNIFILRLWLRIIRRSDWFIVYSINQFIITGFSLGDIRRSKKVELKGNYFKWS